MSKFETNAEENVSAAKGTYGGYVYRAPVGTPLPDSSQWTPIEKYVKTKDTSLEENKTYYTRSGSGTKASPYTYESVESPAVGSIGTYYEAVTGDWTCMGFVNEDGETFSTNTSIQEFRDQNGDVIDTSQSQYGESFSCAFAETKASTFESIYGKDAVKDENGELSVNHDGAEAGAYTYAFLFLLKDGRKWVRFAEKCKRTEINDVKTNSSTLLAWQASYTVIRSETTGGYFKDLFESTESSKE